MQQISLTVLGSTGSVGMNTLDVVAKHPDKLSIHALTASTNVEAMLQQCIAFKPKLVVMANAEAADQLRLLLNDHPSIDTEVLSGNVALCDAAACTESNCVMSAIVGAAGLMPTLAAVQAGKRVLVANKEPLVMTGPLFMQEARKSKAVILPIDSEHNAIFQCLPSDQNTRGVTRIHLTGSGGPFLGKSWADLSAVTPTQACNHPNWSMGKKISVDSATMMNKGLELIEATALFNVATQDINIVIHPQSIIHSMVEYQDGSVLAQMGSPDMRIPIAHALCWPERIDSGVTRLDLTAISHLDFQAPDMDNLPCLRLAQQASIESNSAPIVLNAANEIAVDAFLNTSIRFTDIAVVIEQTLEKVTMNNVNSVDSVLQIDHEARQQAQVAVASLTS